MKQHQEMLLEGRADACLRLQRMTKEGWGFGYLIAGSLAAGMAVVMGVGAKGDVEGRKGTM